MTSQVRIGAMIRRDLAPEVVADHARQLDGAFDELWVVEDLPYAGGIAQLTNVLDATNRARVGHGIAPAPFRNVVALAMEWATLARMHPGRLIAGIGHGVIPWMQSIGAAVASPLTLLEEQIIAVRTLLAGGTCVIEGRYVRLDDITLEFPPAEAVPVMAGVRGPRSLELAGRVADGTVLAGAVSPAEVADMVGSIATGRTATSPPAHEVIVFAPLDPTGRGVDGEWSLDASSVRSLGEGIDALASAGATCVVFVPTTGDPLAELSSARDLVS
jgi:alkanesulfonate monooxygenase SsuD/methylene tetrahydromethanopterin reductase-like flavin-dependent oxidoreductase (luciferase family)